jgi:DNA-binding CsgD family transcriptional regulator
MITLPHQQNKCLEYLSRGMTHKEIGKEMVLSPRTIEYYMNIIKKKTGFKTRSELVQWFFDTLS